MNLMDLALLYGAAGLACAVAVYRSSTESRPRAAAAAALAVPLWPLWAPIALTSSRARRPASPWAEEARGRSPRSVTSEAAARIDAALHEGVEACAGTSLESLLPGDAASRISAEVARAAARHAELMTVLGRQEFDVVSAERRVAELEAAPNPARALISARLHPEIVKRLVSLRDRDARGIEELADLVQALRTQLVLARFAGP